MLVCGVEATVQCSRDGCERQSTEVVERLDHVEPEHSGCKCRQLLKRRDRAV